MLESDCPEENIELQLDSAGDGPGSVIKTAIGSFDNDGVAPIDRTGLPDAPWWFTKFIASKYRKNCVSKFNNLTLENALFLLEEAGVPPMYRLGLGLKWGFIDHRRDGFGEQDYRELMLPFSSDDVPKGFEIDFFGELRRIEARSVYKLWQKWEGF